MDYDDYLLNHIRQLQLIWKRTHDHLEAVNSKRTVNDDDTPTRIFAVGDAVAALIPEGKTEDRLQRKGKGYWDGPFTITRVINPSTYEIQGTGINDTRLNDVRLTWSGYLKPYTPAIPEPDAVKARQASARRTLDERATRLTLAAESRSRYADLYKQ